LVCIYIVGETAATVVVIVGEKAASVVAIDEKEAPSDQPDSNVCVIKEHNPITMYN